MKLNVMQMTDVTGRGGAEKALVDLALRLDRSRFNVTVCVTRTAGNYQPMLDEAGVHSIVLERTSRKESYKMLQMVSILRSLPVHVLHTHLFGANTWGRMLGKLAGVPVVIAHEHWSSKAAHEVWVDRLLYRFSDRILVPSHASKRLVMRKEGIPSRYLDVTYNGVDTALFSPCAERDAVRTALGIEAGDLVVGTVGRLSADKGGQDDLLWAANEARKQYAGPGQVRLLVVGDGPLRGSLQGYAAELGMAAGNTAIFTGVQADVAGLLGAMDIFVLPSLMEALPIAVLEAMSMRLPVVATNVGGVPEVVQDGKTGLLVAPAARPAMRDALLRLASDPALRCSLGQKGQARVHAHFTVEKMVEHVEGLYEKLFLKRYSKT